MLHSHSCGQTKPTKLLSQELDFFGENPTTSKRSSKWCFHIIPTLFGRANFLSKIITCYRWLNLGTGASATPAIMTSGPLLYVFGLLWIVRIATEFINTQTEQGQFVRELALSLICSPTPPKRICVSSSSSHSLSA